MNSKFKKILLLLCIFNVFPILAGWNTKDKSWDHSEKKIRIYTFDINKEIGPSALRITSQAIKEALTLHSDLIIIHMNTYGGLVDAADSIRTQILNCPIPVYVYITNNAASAGALISIAADRIYMHEGSSIGAATAVSQTGEPLPDKYQSFMRSKMRATAEAHGKDTIIKGNDTIIKWHRDPRIAEAMVGPNSFIPGINDSNKVLTFTTDEAIKHGYCEGKANSIKEVIDQAGITRYELKQYQLSGLEKAIGFLMNPVLQGILIMIIVAGIYFEMQSPGLSFPIIAAVLAALLYFSPLYLEGLAKNWELILFVIGIILIGIEIFAIPGFGITGILGIALVVVGLTLSMIDNDIFKFQSSKALGMIFKSFVIVITSMTISIISSIYLSSKLITSSRLQGVALKAEQKSEHGYVSFDDKSTFVGKEGVTITMLRPSGKIEVDGDIYDAISEIGYIDPGNKIKVTKYESGQLYVLKS